MNFGDSGCATLTRMTKDSMSQKSIISKSAKQTQQVAARIAENLRGGEVLLLRGDLGSGKTTFTQGLAHALGVTRQITSPTFIIMRSYNLSKKKGDAINFYHLDLYRTESEKDIKGLGLLELLGQKENIVVIEWPEKLVSKIPKNAISLNFKFINVREREITIENSDIT